MLKVVTIILDIDKRNKILEKRDKKELLNYAKSVAAGSDINVIDPIDMYEQKLKEMCSPLDLRFFGDNPLIFRAEIPEPGQAAYGGIHCPFGELRKVKGKLQHG